MTPNAERALYIRDRAAWARYMAPRWRELARNWTEEQKRFAWSVACEELRNELNRLKELA